MSAIVSALVALAPAIGKLLQAYIQTPEEDRLEFAKDINKAMEKVERDLDTSDLERELRNL